MRRGVDPFEVDIMRALKTLKTHLPGWNHLDDLLLDAEALNQLASIIRLQGEWIRHRASLLYVDPVMIELKIRLASRDELCKALLKSMRPIITIEQISPWRLGEAMDYWNALSSMHERFGEKEKPALFEERTLNMNDLVRMKILSEAEFGDSIENMWRELKESQGTKHGVPYWDFVSTESVEDTVLRAYLTSFMVSEGYADLEVDPIEETMTLITNESPRSGSSMKDPRSVAVSLDLVNRGKKWRRVDD